MILDWQNNRVRGGDKSEVIEGLEWVKWGCWNQLLRPEWRIRIWFSRWEYDHGKGSDCHQNHPNNQLTSGEEMDGRYDDEEEEEDEGRGSRTTWRRRRKEYAQHICIPFWERGYTARWMTCPWVGDPRDSWWHQKKEMTWEGNKKVERIMRRGSPIVTKRVTHILSELCLARQDDGVSFRL